MPHRSLARRAAVALALLVPVAACADASPARAAATVRDLVGARPVPDTARLAGVAARAAALPRLRSLLVQHRDTLLVERYWRGARRESPANIKSASKSVLSAAVGIAIARGDLPGLDATLATLLPADARALDSAKRAITLEDLLTMRAGLQPTSFDNYGSWVSSRDWIRDALRRPMVAPPGHAGGPMLYSTGSSHLVSAILARNAETTTHAYMSRHLFRPLGIRLRQWTTDPRGVHFGGNEMRLTPREMLAFGTLYLKGGRAPDGTQVLPKAWIDSSWVPRTSSPWNGHGYGYGWWSRTARGHRVHFAWGYGGQYIFVVPSLDAVVVMTSDPGTGRDGDHLGALHRLLADEILPALGA